MYKRPVFQHLMERLAGAPRFIQVLAGPRQTGKTTLARQVMEDYPGPAHYASADEPALKDRSWIEQQWEVARLRGQVGEGSASQLLVLDEIQKIPQWSEVVKRLWDQDVAAGRPLRVLVLGSSPLLVKSGLTESLAGRFEIIPVTHWSFTEMRDAFGWDVERFVYFGGYPGAAPLAGDRDRWARYIVESLIETTVSRDVLLMSRVHKPALLRRVFELACSYSGQILSYQKMLGQLQDAGNTVTVAHYLELLAGAGLAMGLAKYSGHRVRQRASSPKVLAMNSALITATSSRSFEEARSDPAFWGRLVESAVGATLVNGSIGTDVEVFYWVGRNREVDFVLRRGATVAAIEVKSGRRRADLPGMEEFARRFDVSRKLLVGAQGIPLDEFLSAPVDVWVR